MKDAYAAGIFDANGTCGIYKYDGAPWSPVLAVATGHKPTAEALREWAGAGSVFLDGKKGPGHLGIERNRDSFRFQLRAWGDIAAVVRVLIPHSMEKLDQLLLMQEACEIAPGRNGTREQKIAARERYSEIYRELKRLKGK